jgi:hypothetical protein
MPPVGFEPTIPASARPQTYDLDSAVTRIGLEDVRGLNIAARSFDFGNTWKFVVRFVISQH